MKVCLIWAQGQNQEIGVDNRLPWRLPEDLAHFKKVTSGYPVLMGRRTFESLPNGALPGRPNIVISQGLRLFHGAAHADNFEDGIGQARALGATCLFVIGGTQVYQAAIDSADVLFVTEVAVTEPRADAFAPNIPSTYQLSVDEPWQTSKAGLQYRFRQWTRSS